MIQSAAVALSLLILGDAIAERLALPVPGAALGLAALSLRFALRGGPDPASGRLFDVAAPFFPLFFVPAAVGVIVEVDMLGAIWVFALAAVLPGTILALLVAGWTFQTLLKRAASGEKA